MKLCVSTYVLIPSPWLSHVFYAAAIMCVFQRGVHTYLFAFFRWYSHDLYFLKILKWVLTKKQARWNKEMLLKNTEKPARDKGRASRNVSTVGENWVTDTDFYSTVRSNYNLGFTWMRGTFVSPFFKKYINFTFDTSEENRGIVSKGMWLLA